MKSPSERDVSAVEILLTRSHQSSKHQHKAGGIFLQRLDIERMLVPKPNSKESVCTI